VSGLSEYEPTGRWTVGENVIFTFAKTLPKNFTLDIEVQGAFGPNIGKPIMIEIGDWHKAFCAQAVPTSYKFNVKTAKSSNAIQFIIPEPKSPKELGASEDPRQLGIMFKNIRIFED
jgi:hypothetical protein